MRRKPAWILAFQPFLRYRKRRLPRYSRQRRQAPGNRTKFTPAITAKEFPDASVRGLARLTSDGTEKTNAFTGLNFFQYRPIKLPTAARLPRWRQARDVESTNRKTSDLLRRI